MDEQGNTYSQPGGEQQTDKHGEVCLFSDAGEAGSNNVGHSCREQATLGKSDERGGHPRSRYSEYRMAGRLVFKQGAEEVWNTFGEEEGFHLEVGRCGRRLSQSFAEGRKKR